MFRFAASALLVSVASFAVPAGAAGPQAPESAQNTSATPQTPAAASGAVVWRDPGDVARLDLASGPGGASGAPKAPFTFLKEDTSGSNPKIKVRDANGVVWSVKWGREVHADLFASRLAWAAGYVVEPSYFVATGRVEGAKNLERAKRFVSDDGTMREARFERRDEDVERLTDEKSWRWDTNPFAGSHELAGLKVLVMLTSNWDDKDARDFRQNGSNTSIWRVRRSDGTAEESYVVSDWGGTMGKWGRPGKGWTTWDCAGYSGQSHDFVKAGDDGSLRWGFEGQHADVTEGVTPSDVAWLMQYLGRLTDDQLRAALDASGATPSERDCFARAVRERIEMLRAVIPQAK